jgi:hypothetical protein
MAIIVKPDDGIDLSKSVVPVVDNNPTLVLFREDVREKLMVELSAEVDAYVPDLSTKKGRDAVATFAFKFTRSKTAVQGAAKEVNAEFYGKIEDVNRVRDTMAKRFDALRDRARAPLTEWEEDESARLKAEAEKQAATQAKIDEFKHASVVMAHETAAMVAARIERVEALDGEEPFTVAKTAALSMLFHAHEKLTQQEADAAELKRLRDAETERKCQEALLLQSEREPKPFTGSPIPSLSGISTRRKEFIEKITGEIAATGGTGGEASKGRTLGVDLARGDDASVTAAHDTAMMVSVLSHRKLEIAKQALVRECFGIDTAAAAEVMDAIVNGLIPGVSFNS